MRIIIFGKNGQVGREITNLFKGKGIIKCFDRKSADFNRPRKVISLINKFKPNIIINCAAYTNVEQAEKYPKAAMKINNVIVSHIAKAAKKNNAILIHFSTDFIFDGKKVNSYTENDSAVPLSVYGKSKLLGENAIKDSGCKSVIFRTTWVYSVKGNNFLNKILYLLENEKNIKVIRDIYGVPCSANMVAKVTYECVMKIIENNNINYFGVYNLVPNGKTNLYQIALLLKKILQDNKIYKNYTFADLIPIDKKEFHSKVNRPSNSMLNNKKIQQKFNIKLSHWKNDIYEFMKFRMTGKV